MCFFLKKHSLGVIAAGLFINQKPHKCVQGNKSTLFLQSNVCIYNNTLNPLSIKTQGPLCSKLWLCPTVIKSVSNSADQPFGLRNERMKRNQWLVIYWGLFSSHSLTETFPTWYLITVFKESETVCGDMKKSFSFLTYQHDVFPFRLNRPDRTWYHIL